MRSIPYIPFLPVHLRDLVFLEDQPDMLTSSTGDLIDFQKLSNVYNIISQILSSQKTYVCDGLQLATANTEKQMVVVGSRDGAVCGLSCATYVKEVALATRDEEILFELSGEIKPYPHSKTKEE
jgi:hypothetical protein